MSESHRKCYIAGPPRARTAPRAPASRRRWRCSRPSEQRHRRHSISGAPLPGSARDCAASGGGGSRGDAAGSRSAETLAPLLGCSPLKARDKNRCTALHHAARAGDEATGVRRVGDLELTYKGAKPDWSARRELTRRFLCGAPRAF